MKWMIPSMMLGLCLVTNPVTAQTYQPETEVITQKLAEVSKEVQDSISGISIEAEDISVKFPEYQSAVEVFKSQLNTTSEKFTANMSGIAEFISKELSREYSELEAVKKLYEVNRNSAMKTLLADKEKRLKERKKQIQKQINSSYQGALKSFVGLNNHLEYIIKKGFKDVGGYDWEPRWAYWTSLGNSDYDRSTSLWDSGRASIAKKVFKNCQTAGCTYLMDESYRNFVKAAFKFNKTIDLADGLKLKKMGWSKRKINKEIKKMAQTHAQTQPIGIFTNP